MPPDRLPSPLARAALRMMPVAMLQRMIEVLMCGMRREHPKLFQNLLRLNPAVVRIEPTDLPHRFILAYGKDGVSLTVVPNAPQPCSACIKGKLEALLDLLEGRSDGDTLFFSRGIEITGDTGVVVALRNTIDREEINLLDDATGWLGPFAFPARRAIVLVDRLALRVRSRVEEICEESRR
ncbi:MAG: SCP2 sterol-binding domain-containing protein [Alphaproteobacteria bacterium]|nr:SCP2 sterol-binding domain-containing protein [Alphaproteobacteria bacterium]